MILLFAIVCVFFIFFIRSLTGSEELILRAPAAVLVTVVPIHCVYVGTSITTARSVMV